MKPAIRRWIKTRVAMPGPDALPAPSVLEPVARWSGPPASLLMPTGQPVAVNPDGEALLALLAPSGADRIKLAATAAPCSREPIALLLSGGLSPAEPNLTPLTGGLMAGVDEVMYRAKRVCENRCELAARARIP
jgi:hypothetical protein